MGGIIGRIKKLLLSSILFYGLTFSGSPSLADVQKKSELKDHKVSGVVIDQYTNQPVQGVTVKTDNIQTCSDEYGKFFITADPGEKTKIDFSHVGYFPKDTSVDNFADFSLFLEPRVINIEGLRVSPSTPMRSLKKKTIDNDLNFTKTEEQVREDPGALLDTYRAAKAPGVKKTSSMTSAVKMPGSETFETGYRRDGINLDGFPFKLGGTLSSSTPGLAEVVTVKSWDDAYNGGGLAGNIEMQSPDTVSVNELRYDLGTIYGMLTGKKSFGTVDVSASYFKTYRLLMDLTNKIKVPKSQSLETAVNIHFNKKFLKTFKVYGLALRDKLDEPLMEGKENILATNAQDVIIASTKLGLVQNDKIIGNIHLKGALERYAILVDEDDENHKKSDEGFHIDFSAEVQTFKPEMELVTSYGKTNLGFCIKRKMLNLNGNLEGFDPGDGFGSFANMDLFKEKSIDVRTSFFAKHSLTDLFIDGLNFEGSIRNTSSSLYKKEDAFSYSAKIKSDLPWGSEARLIYRLNEKHPSNTTLFQRRGLFWDDQTIEPEHTKSISFDFMKPLSYDFLSGLLIYNKNDWKYQFREPRLSDWLMENGIDPHDLPEQLDIDGLLSQQPVATPVSEPLMTRTRSAGIVVYIKKLERPSNLFFGSAYWGMQRSKTRLSKEEELIYDGNELRLVTLPEAEIANELDYPWYFHGDLGINLIRNKLNALVYFDFVPAQKITANQLDALAYDTLGVGVTDGGEQLYHIYETRENETLPPFATINLGINYKWKGMHFSLYMHNLGNLFFGQNKELEKVYSREGISLLSNGNNYRLKDVPAYATFMISGRLF